MDAFWAVPEWAPADESHLLGSSSVVTKIAYGKGSLTYSTFDPSSTDVLRLAFVPDAIFADGHPLPRVPNLSQEGYTFDDATRVLRIRRDRARDVDIEGPQSEPVPLIVDFDNPHLGANAALRGQYPSGVIDWGEGQWKTCAPRGRMSTFSLCTAGQEKKAQFRFAYERILMRLDVYNSSNAETRVRIYSPQTPALAITLKPHELRRFKTGWLDRVSSVTLESESLPSLLFDNLAYSPYLWGQPARP